jgi:hypothetical protein
MPNTRETLLTLSALALLAGCGGRSAAEAPAAPAPAAEAPVPAAEAPAPDAAALYTADQAQRGEAAYERTCLECHTRVEFKERPFLFAWEGTSVAQVYSYVAENMPDDGPGSLQEQVYLDVMAFILEMNGYPAGSDELTADLERMSQVPFQGHGGGHP